MPLPGPRALWWALSLLALVLPFAAVLAPANVPPDAALASISFEVRVRNVAYLLGNMGRAEAARRAAERRARGDDEARTPAPALPIARATTTTDGDDDDRPQLRRAKPIGQAAEASPTTAGDVGPAEDGRAPRGPTRDAHDGGDAGTDGELAAMVATSIRELASRAERLATRDARLGRHAQTQVITHAVAVGAHDLAGELAARVAEPDDDLRAALAATARTVGAPPTSTAALSVEDALARAKRDRFGIRWSPFVRDRIRQKLGALGGDREFARSSALRQQTIEDEIVPLIATIFEFLAFAGLLGVGLSLYILATSGAARGRGEPAFGWLRARLGGMPAREMWPSDPMLPALGLGTWLVATMVVSALVEMMPSARGGSGLAVLFQTLAGVMVAWALTSAFGRGVSPFDSASLVDPDGERSALRASAAAVLGYCVLLPWMALAALASALAWALLMPEAAADPHPVAGLLLEDHSPLQVGALALAVVVGAPLGEELVFRAFLYRTLRQHLGVRWAMVLSALAFALLHLAAPLLLPYVLLGVAFAVLYEWTGSLWASITLHALWNAVVLALIVLVSAT